MASLVMKTVTLPVRDDGSLRLAIVADTHSAPHRAAATLLAARRPDAILHAGDIGDLAVLDALSTVAPVLAVRGNIDVRAPGLPDVLTLNLVSNADLALRILLVHIAVNGPKLRADIVRLARAAEASLVVCGHSHVPFIGRDRGLTVFNPGSIGPRRFHLPILFGILDLMPTEVRLAHVDCETGNAWNPPAAQSRGATGARSPIQNNEGGK
ncbi:MAG TPA: metallophosphoesterase family protein [Polyangiaceae bacterium]|nr:metallophosphoesterase family protein [Polyangiaceae bacterium]